MYVNDVTNLTLKRNHFYHCSVMDVFITGGSVHPPAATSRTTSSRSRGRTPASSRNTALAFQFRNGGNPSPDPSNWDFRYNTFVGPLSITPAENPVGPGGMRVIGNVFLSGDPCGLSNTTYDYNAFVTGRAAARTRSPTASPPTSPASLNPGDPGNYSLKPAASSATRATPANYPSKDRTGASRYTGDAPDLGAYEAP